MKLPAFLRRKPRPERLPVFGVEDVRPKFYSDSQAERDRSPEAALRAGIGPAALYAVEPQHDAEDFPGSTMTPPPFGRRVAVAVAPGIDPVKVAREANRLAPPPPPAPIGFNPAGMFVVVRDRVDDVLDVRFVPAAYVVEDVASDPTGGAVVGHLLDRNGTIDLDSPQAVDSYTTHPRAKVALGRFNAGRVLARFHTFEDAALALDAARTAWLESNASPMARAVTTLTERVQTARADVQAAHAQADEAWDRMVQPATDKLAEIVADRQEAALNHVAARDRAVKDALNTLHRLA